MLVFFLPPVFWGLPLSSHLQFHLQLIKYQNFTRVSLAFFHHPEAGPMPGALPALERGSGLCADLHSPTGSVTRVIPCYLECQKEDSTTEQLLVF